jgi:uncharacterized protein (DUF58 family)
MTRRGGLALALGCATYLAGWAFGSRPLVVVAVGLVLASVVSWLLVHLTPRPVELRHEWDDLPLEGGDVHLGVEVELEARVLPGLVTLVERYATLGEQRAVLTRAERMLHAQYTIRSVPRGRYRLESAAVRIEDPFGLERRDVPLDAAATLVVYPRLVELGRLFSETGSTQHDGRRLLLRRPTGYDLHSVREYVEGDSLRKVHWRTTARRGQLMVRELEDAPRDDVAVVLDAWDGSPPEVFDVAVRAAGSILHAYVRRGQSAALVVGGDALHVQRIRAEGEWRRALDLLAGAERGDTPAEQLLSGERNPATLALDVVVVTSRLDRSLVDQVAARGSARHGTSFVYVAIDERRDPSLLRLAAAGVPVAVVRVGDDLSTVLSAAGEREAVHA